MKKFAWLLLLALSACTTTQQAPVIERATRPAAPAATTQPKPAVPETHTVKQGDTLYSIGVAYGIDHREIARLNDIAPPYAIRIGQVLRLKPAAPTATAPAPSPEQAGAVATPIVVGPGPEGKPLTDGAAGPGGTPAPTADGGIPLLTEPKAGKLPYSAQALAGTDAGASTSVPGEQSTSATATADGITWSWPASGKILAGFNDTTTAKGLDIAGTLGQPVLAAADGKVVYSGTGLRGYGQLIIIKHNATYLSAYAHNSKLLVKEGEQIIKGQKIAEMGSSDSDRVKLHFEIRKQGQPVDPIKYLPATPG